MVDGSNSIPTPILRPDIYVHIITRLVSDIFVWLAGKAFKL